MTFLSPFLLLAALAAQQPGPAGDWVPLGEVEGIRLSYDRTPVGRTGDLVTVRFRAQLPPTPQGPALTVSLVEIRCNDANARTMRTVNYMADGSEGRIDNVPVPFEPIPADSFFGAIQRAVC